MTSWLLLLDRALDDDVEEALRIAVGALAAGATVQVVASQATRESLDAGDGSEAAEDFVRTLQESHGAFTSWEVADFQGLLGACDHLLRVAAADRAHTPPLCVVTDDWLRTTSPAEITASLRSAGQVIRER